MGEFHLRKYLALPEANVVGIFDVDSARAQEIAAKYQVKAFSSVSDILFESDAVTIASSTASHYQLARLAFESGVHVLLEKPVTNLVSEAEHLVRLADEQTETKNRSEHAITPG